MRSSTRMVMVAVLALLLIGCEREEAQVQQEPAEDSRAAETEATQEEKSALPVVSERIEEETEQRDKLESEEDGTGTDTQQTVETEESAAGETVEEPTETAAAAGEMPQSVTYDASFGAVTFPHVAHSEMLECGNCHTTDPPERITLDKDSAHDLCRGCHEEQGAGPTGCRDCHVKE